MGQDRHRLPGWCMFRRLYEIQNLVISSRESPLVSGISNPVKSLPNHWDVRWLGVLECGGFYFVQEAN
jgi:hypothetical protein